MTKLGNDSKQKSKQKQQTTARTEKLVVSMSKCLTKSSDNEEYDDTELILKLMSTNTRLTPKLKRLHPRTVGAGAKELASYSCKSSTNSSSNAKKSKEDATDNLNMNQIPKKIKPSRAVKKQ